MIVLGVLFIVLGALVAIGDAFAGFSVITLVNAVLCFAYGFNGLIDTENRKVNDDPPIHPIVVSILCSWLICCWYRWFSLGISFLVTGWMLRLGR